MSSQPISENLENVENKCNECDRNNSKDINFCNDCKKRYCYFCSLLSFHVKCMKCFSICCSPIQVCRKCKNGNAYHFITPLVAIGNKDTPYDDFDVVVNLNYPENNVPHRRVALDNREKIIYYIGLCDHPKEKLFITRLIPKILNELENYSGKKILFHCFAGISRSATIAIAYLKKYDPEFQSQSLLSIFFNAQEKRSVICPNQGFIEALSDYFKEDSFRFINFVTE